MFFYERIKIRTLIGVSMLLFILLAIVAGILEGFAEISIDENLMQFLIDAGLLLWLYLKFKKSGNSISDFTKGIKKAINWKEIAYLLILHFLITIGTIFIILLIVSYINPEAINSILNDESIVVPETFISKVFYLISVVFFAPIIEEIIFRGVILNRLKNKWGLVSAIVISSVLFGILHYRLAILGALTFGICMCILYLRTRNIGVCILTHFINNFLASILMISPNETAANAELLALEDARIIGWVIGVPLFLISSAFLTYYVRKNWPQIKNNVLNFSGKGTALMVIDMQEGLFSLESEHLYNSEELLDKTSKLIDKAKDSNIQVIYIQHGTISKGLLQHGTEGWRIHHRVSPVKGDLVIHKSRPNPFDKTNLKKELEDRNIGNLIITGLQTEYCIDTTCRYASSLGYKVTLVSDCHSTFDTSYLEAEKIVEHHNKVLGNSFVNLKSTEEILMDGICEL